MQRVTEAHSANAATAKPESRILTRIIRPGTVQRNVGLPLLRLHRFPHRFHDLRSRWQDPQKRRRAAVNHRVAVHDDLEHAVAVVDHLYVGLQLTPEARRHTGSVQAGHSVRAVVDGDTGHARVVAKRGSGVQGVNGAISFPRSQGG